MAPGIVRLVELTCRFQKLALLLAILNKHKQKCNLMSPSHEVNMQVPYTQRKVFILKEKKRNNSEQNRKHFESSSHFDLR